jgi:hypothetical protein
LGWKRKRGLSKSSEKTGVVSGREKRKTLARTDLQRLYEAEKLEINKCRQLSAAT